MADVTLVLWRDIPAQVLQGKGRGAVRITLDERFEQAIDRAAMKAGLSGTDDYLGEWRRETVQAEDAQAHHLGAAATRLEAPCAGQLLAVHGSQHIHRGRVHGGKLALGVFPAQRLSVGHESDDGSAVFSEGHFQTREGELFGVHRSFERRCEPLVGEERRHRDGGGRGRHDQEISPSTVMDRLDEPARAVRNTFALDPIHLFALEQSRHVRHGIFALEVQRKAVGSIFRSSPRLNLLLLLLLLLLELPATLYPGCEGASQSHSSGSSDDRAIWWHHCCT